MTYGYTYGIPITAVQQQSTPHSPKSSWPLGDGNALSWESSRPWEDRSTWAQRMTKCVKSLLEVEAHRNPILNKKYTEQRERDSEQEDSYCKGRRLYRRRSRNFGDNDPGKKMDGHKRKNKWCRRRGGTLFSWKGYPSVDHCCRTELSLQLSFLIPSLPI